jgi:hypothetical protein
MLACGLYAGDQAIIDEYSKKFFQETLIKQIEPDGSMPAEMARTRPYNYGVYTLVGYCPYAEMARNLGIDFYNFSGPKGQTLKKAFEWFIPFLKGDVKSPKKEEDMRLDRVFLMMRLGSLRYENPYYESYMEHQFPDWMGDYRNVLWPPPAPKKP